MKKESVLWLCLFGSTFLFSQKHRVYGTVTIKNSGEQLIGANIYIKNSQFYTTSNSYGFYSVALLAETVQFDISDIGFRLQTTPFLEKQCTLTPSPNINNGSVVFYHVSTLYTSKRLRVSNKKKQEKMLTNKKRCMK